MSHLSLAQRGPPGYPGEYERLWSEPAKNPNLIHWVGPPILDADRPINQLFYDYLTSAEREKWDALCQQRRAKVGREHKRLNHSLRKAARFITLFDERKQRRQTS